MFDYNIWHTLFLSTEVFWPWTREPNCPSKFSSIMDDFYFKGGHTSRHMELKAFTRSFHSYLAVCQLLLLCTSSQKPQPALSPFCFHSLLSKNNLTMYLPHCYICTSLRSRRPKDFGNQTRTVRKVRGRARSCVSTLLLRPSVTGASATQVTAGVVFNPSSPKSDQHQISPCNINAS